MFEISCKDDIGIKELFFTLCEEIMEIVRGLETQTGEKKIGLAYDEGGRSNATCKII